MQQGITGDIIQFRLIAKSPKEAKDELRQTQDEVEKILDQQPEESDSDVVQDSSEEDKALDNFLRLNVALKILQIVGQILRNFPGSLDGEVKLRITSESYLLGLRTLRSLLIVFETNTSSHFPENRG